MRFSNDLLDHVVLAQAAKALARLLLHPVVAAAFGAADAAGAVTRNRLAAARLVFIFGMVGSFAALSRAAPQKRKQLGQGEAGGESLKGLGTLSSGYGAPQPTRGIGRGIGKPVLPGWRCGAAITSICRRDRVPEKRGLCYCDPAAMPRRNDLRRILIIGSGPIVIGQACEFDYSGHAGRQGARVGGLRRRARQLEPGDDHDRSGARGADVRRAARRPRRSARIIERETPDALLPTLGGQTALNLALALDADGMLKRLGVELIGASPAAIRKAEDRAALQGGDDARLGSRVAALGRTRTRSKRRATVVEETGYPAILRPSFTHGRQRRRHRRRREAELEPKVSWALEQSPTREVLVEESVLGWKEYELEVIRDRADNFIVVCSIENIDPMGVHTGDSITVAPAMTLTDREYQRLRDAARAVMTEIGVETGGSNVQFAVNPDGRPRRSSSR